MSSIDEGQHEVSLKNMATVKPQSPQPNNAEVEGGTTAEDATSTTILPSDKQILIGGSESSSSEEDSEEETWHKRKRSLKYPKAKWWFQEPAVKRNWLVVVGAWFLVFLGIGSIVAGVVLEVLYHTASLDVVRGFIFFVVAAVLLIPSMYAVTHIYLAAKRVGRVRFSSVWFFRS